MDITSMFTDGSVSLQIVLPALLFAASAIAIAVIHTVIKRKNVQAAIKAVVPHSADRANKQYAPEFYRFTDCSRRRDTASGSSGSGEDVTVDAVLDALNENAEKIDQLEKMVIENGVNDRFDEAVNGINERLTGIEDRIDRLIFALDAEAGWNVLNSSMSNIDRNVGYIRSDVSSISKYIREKEQ